MIRSEKMQGDVRLVSDNPRVMGCGRNVEQVPSSHFDHSPIRESCGSGSGKDKAHVFHLAVALSQIKSHVLRPSPAGLVGCAPNGHAAEAHQFEPADLVRGLRSCLRAI